MKTKSVPMRSSESLDESDISRTLIDVKFIRAAVNRTR